MKKSLVLAMALAMGVTASAYAANPFSDVPAGHWAYDAVDKLAAAGVIDGMGNGQFEGDKTMTRYEMAQIVAKAMAKGANVEKLAAEFADELDQLGVRVAKLEKKSDNVTITGQIRYDHSNAQYENSSATAAHRLQTRLFLKGQINDDWSYNARFQNRQDFTTRGADSTINLDRAWVSGKLFGLKVDAGRQQLFLADGNLHDSEADMVKLAYGKNVKLTVYAAQPTNAAVDQTIDAKNKASVSFGHAYGAEVAAKFGAVNARIGYDAFKDGDLAETIDGTATTKYGAVDDKIWNVGVSGNIGKLNLNATYLKASTDMDKAYDASTTGFVLGAKYGAADANKAGTWGVWAKYYNQGVGTFLAHTMNGDLSQVKFEGFKGYGVGVEYTFAKNITGYVEYYGLKGKETDNKDNTLFGRLQFAF